MATYALRCNVDYPMPDGTAPAGSIINVILLDDPGTYPAPDGLTLEPWDGVTQRWTAPVQLVVPASVSMFQCRALLNGMPSPTNANLTFLQDVDSAMHVAGGIALIAWEYETVVARYGPLVLQMAVVFHLSDAQLDQMFIAASQITA